MAWWGWLLIGIAVFLGIGIGVIIVIYRLRNTIWR